MNETLYDVTQTTIEADAGGEGDVIMASAISLVQGLWPATTTYNTTLANGSTIVGPLGGYQVSYLALWLGVSSTNLHFIVRSG